MLVELLDIIEHALRDPTKKAAVQIAIDGVAAWREVAALPSIVKLEADVMVYRATLPPSEQPPPIEAPAQPEPSRPQTVQEFQRWQAEHPNG